MNEQECLDFCTEKLIHFDMKPVEEKAKIRQECNAFCAERGISGTKMDMLWNRAMLFARMRG